MDPSQGPLVSGCSLCVGERRGARLEFVHAVKLIFGFGWGAFWVYWFVAALSTKRGRVSWSREARIRALLAVAVIVTFHSGVLRGGALNADPWRYGFGLFLFALGLGLAVWARIHIGRNWGTPMSQKLEPELVTSGPYQVVRHPIYSGILLAGLATALALNWHWLYFDLFAGIYFIYSATVEERFLTEKFPGEYPAYRRGTKMLIPFVF